MTSKGSRMFGLLTAILAACTAPPVSDDAPECPSAVATPPVEEVLLRYRLEPFALRQTTQSRLADWNDPNENERYELSGGFVASPIGSKIKLAYSTREASSENGFIWSHGPRHRRLDNFTGARILDERGAVNTAATATLPENAADEHHRRDDTLHGLIGLPELPAEPLVVGVPVRTITHSPFDPISATAIMEIHTTTILRAVHTDRRIAVVDVSATAHGTYRGSCRGLQTESAEATRDCTLEFDLETALPTRWTCHGTVTLKQCDMLLNLEHRAFTTHLESTYAPA